MILVGSHAINYHLPGFRKKPRDWDLIATEQEAQAIALLAEHELEGSNHSVAFRMKDGAIVDIEIIQPGTAADDLYWLPGTPFTVVDTDIGRVLIPPLDVLYTLKLSHRYLKDSPHFLKTMLDIRQLREAGCQVFDADWLKRREAETYHYQHPNLKRSKQEFFTGDAVDYQYDHDSLHQAVKLGAVPAYSLFSTTGEEVFSSKKKFFALTEQERLNAVLEESYVLALERSLIPFDFKPTKEQAFRMALEKVCTSITSGWFREYAWEHYFEALASYSGEYTDKFFLALMSGDVKPAAVSKQ